MGMGFYVGWRGMDVLKYFGDTIAGWLGTDVAGLSKAYVDIQSLAFTPLMPLKALDFLVDLSGKAVADQGVAKKPTTVQDITEDGNLTDLEKKIAIVKHDIDARLVLGCLGAIAAAAITTPGFMQGVGEIVPG